MWVVAMARIPESVQCCPFVSLNVWDSYRHVSEVTRATPKLEFGCTSKVHFLASLWSFRRACAHGWRLVPSRIGSKVN